MMLTRRAAAAGAALLFGLAAALSPAAPARAAEAVELVMVEEHGCMWCARWDAEISAIYPKTEAGRTAPLRRIDIRERRPDDITFARPLTFTPTFVLVRDGVEVSRIEGYPGEDFFWGLLEMHMRTHLGPEGAS